MVLRYENSFKIGRYGIRYASSYCSDLIIYLIGYGLGWLLLYCIHSLISRVISKLRSRRQRLLNERFKRQVDQRALDYKNYVIEPQTLREYQLLEKLKVIEKIQKLQQNELKNIRRRSNILIFTNTFLLIALKFRGGEIDFSQLNLDSLETSKFFSQRPNLAKLYEIHLAVRRGEWVLAAQLLIELDVESLTYSLMNRCLDPSKVYEVIDSQLRSEIRNTLTLDKRPWKVLKTGQHLTQKAAALGIIFYVRRYFASDLAANWLNWDGVISRLLLYSYQATHSPAELLVNGLSSGLIGYLGALGLMQIMVLNLPEATMLMILFSIATWTGIREVTQRYIPGADPNICKNFFKELEKIKYLQLTDDGKIEEVTAYRRPTSMEDGKGITISDQEGTQSVDLVPSEEYRCEYDQKNSHYAGHYNYNPTTKKISSYSDPLKDPLKTDYEPSDFPACDRLSQNIDRIFKQEDIITSKDIFQKLEDPTKYQVEKELIERLNLSDGSVLKPQYFEDQCPVRYDFESQVHVKPDPAPVSVPVVDESNPIVILDRLNQI